MWNEELTLERSDLWEVRLTRGVFSISNEQLAMCNELLAMCNELLYLKKGPAILNSKNESLATNPPPTFPPDVTLFHYSSPSFTTSLFIGAFKCASEAGSANDKAVRLTDKSLRSTASTVKIEFRLMIVPEHFLRHRGIRLNPIVEFLPLRQLFVFQKA